MSTAVTTDPRKTEAHEDQSRAIGRGALYLTLTKLWFIAASYVIYLGIPRIGGGDATGLLGDYKAVGAWLSVISTVLVQGTTQAVARFVGRKPGGWRAIVSQGLKIQAVLGTVVAGAFFLAAPHVAGEDTQLVTPLRIAAAIPLVYAMYAVLLGTLNGTRRFAEQAFVDGTFTTLKVVLVLGGVLAFGTVAGAYLGFASCAAAIFVLALVTLLRDPGGAQGEAPSAGEILRFQVQTVGFMAAVQWVVQMDLWYVKWWSEIPDAAQKTAGDLYAGAQVFSQISYSAVIAVTFVLFPLISGTSLRKDPGQARGYVREALRYALVLVCAVALPISAAPRDALRILLPRVDESLAACPGADQALRWLALGYVAFAIFFLLCSVLNAAGRPRASIALGILVVGIQAGLGAVLVPRLGLEGQGIAGLVAMAAGLVAAAAVVGKELGSVIPGPTVCRVGVAGAAAYAFVTFWQPASLVFAVGRIAAAGVLFLLVLVALREFTAADRQRFFKVLPGGRRQ